MKGVGDYEARRGFKARYYEGISKKYSLFKFLFYKILCLWLLRRVGYSLELLGRTW